MTLTKKNTLIFLLIILAIAGFFRLWQLNSIPPGLYPDVAINGNDVLDSLANKQFKVFYPENNGREGLFIWLIAFSFYIFGPSIWAIKIVPAVIGILTVLGLYLLTKELFKNALAFQHSNIPTILALLASFFLAVSFWHVNFSRLGFRAILIPFILVFGFYFMLLAFKNWKIYNFIISGILFGLGFYTYISYRGIILILALFLFLKFFEYSRKYKIRFNWQWLWNKVYLKDKWWKVDLFILMIILTALPIGIYFLNHPADFLGRAVDVSILKSENPIYELGKSIIVHLAMFNFYGDANWRHNFSGSPQLLWIVGLFFIIGLILSIKNFLFSLKNKEGFKFHVSCFMLTWFLIMLLPGFLSAEGIPHALRVIGVIPVVYIFSALGAYWTFIQINPVRNHARPAFSGAPEGPKGRAISNGRQILFFYLCLSLFLFAVAYAQFDKYFYKWAKNPEVEGAFSKNYFTIGNYLNSLPDDISKYVIVNQSGVSVPFPNGIPMPAQTPIFIERTIYGQPRAIYLLPENLNLVRDSKDMEDIQEKQGISNGVNQIKIEKGEKMVIIPLQYDKKLFQEISDKFQGGKFQEKDGIWIFEF